MNKETKEAQQRQDLEWVMSTEQGRRFVWRLLGECCVYHDIVGEGAVAFRQIGRRQVGLFITDLITQHIPDSFMLMMVEHQRTLNEERLNERASNDTGTIDDYITGSEARTYIDTTIGHVAGL